MGTQHFPALDGLRAIAVLAVIAYHAGAPAGYVGVDVFFVISGYVITRVLLADGSLPAFYARRARRILPAAFLVVVATLTLSFLMLPSAGDVARSAAAAGVFVANIHFQSVTGGYWDQSAETMPLLHLWSLSVEEQFYLLWPLVLLFGRKWIGWLALASLALYAVLSYFSPEAAFYQTPARAWELAAGGLVALGKVRPIKGGLSIVFLACILPMPVWVAQPLAVVGTTMLVASIHAGHRSVLEAKPLVWIGLISYSLYLWHWPLLAIDRALRVGETPLQFRLVLVGVSFVLAVLSYRYVEQPFRRMRFPSVRTAAVGVMASVALAGSSCAIGLRSEASPDVMAARDYPARDCHALDTDAPRMKCEPKGDLLVWGDSMAYAWMPAFAGADEATRDACPPMLGYLPETKRALTCSAYNDSVALRAERMDTVVLVAWWMRYEDLSPLVATLERLKGVRRVVIVGPTPVMRETVPMCIRLGNEDQCAITRQAFISRAGPILEQMRGLAKRYPNLEVMDVTDGFCNATTCPPVLGGVALYWDTHHISTTAARR